MAFSSLPKAKNTFIWISKLGKWKWKLRSLIEKTFASICIKQRCTYSLSKADYGAILKAPLISTVLLSRNTYAKRPPFLIPSATTHTQYTCSLAMRKIHLDKTFCVVKTHTYTLFSPLLVESCDFLFLCLKMLSHVRNGDSGFLWTWIDFPETM